MEASFRLLDKPDPETTWNLGSRRSFSIVNVPLRHIPQPAGPDAARPRLMRSFTHVFNRVDVARGMQISFIWSDSP